MISFCCCCCCCSVGCGLTLGNSGVLGGRGEGGPAAAEDDVDDAADDAGGGGEGDLAALSVCGVGESGAKGEGTPMGDNGGESGADGESGGDSGPVVDTDIGAVGDGGGDTTLEDAGMGSTDLRISSGDATGAVESAA